MNHESLHINASSIWVEYYFRTLPSANQINQLGNANILSHVTICGRLSGVPCLKTPDLLITIPKIASLHIMHQAEGSRNVFLFVPNLIGYGRIILMVTAFYFIQEPFKFLPLYLSSCLLDVADGYAARLLNQGSRFGAVLDMVTDRSTTAGLMCHLAYCYPNLTLIFQLLIALDLSSHYLQMYASLSLGADSHKSIQAGQPFLLRLYYTSRVVLFVACGMNEMFFVSLYAIHHLPTVTIPRLIGAKEGMSLWWLILWISFPIWLFKQAMNITQLVFASQELANLDKGRLATSVVTPASPPATIAASFNSLKKIK